MKLYVLYEENASVMCVVRESARLHDAVCDDLADCVDSGQSLHRHLPPVQGRPIPDHPHRPHPGSTLLLLLLLSSFPALASPTVA